jgi:hypothetical protein
MPGITPQALHIDLDAPTRGLEGVIDLRDNQQSETPRR